jgi:hypothetical protein
VASLINLSFFPLLCDHEAARTLHHWGSNRYRECPRFATGMLRQKGSLAQSPSQTKSTVDTPSRYRRPASAIVSHDFPITATGTSHDSTFSVNTSTKSSAGGMVSMSKKTWSKPNSVTSRSLTLTKIFEGSVLWALQGHQGRKSSGGKLN